MLKYFAFAILCGVVHPAEYLINSVENGTWDFSVQTNVTLHPADQPCLRISYFGNISRNDGESIIRIERFALDKVDLQAVLKDSRYTEADYQFKPLEQPIVITIKLTDPPNVQSYSLPMTPVLRYYLGQTVHDICRSVLAKVNNKHVVFPENSVFAKENIPASKKWRNVPPSASESSNLMIVRWLPKTDDREISIESFDAVKDRFERTKVLLKDSVIESIIFLFAEDPVENAEGSFVAQARSKLDPTKFKERRSFEITFRRTEKVKPEDKK